MTYGPRSETLERTGARIIQGGRHSRNAISTDSRVPQPNPTMGRYISLYQTTNVRFQTGFIPVNPGKTVQLEGNEKRKRKGGGKQIASQTACQPTRTARRRCALARRALAGGLKIASGSGRNGKAWLVLHRGKLVACLLACLPASPSLCEQGARICRAINSILSGSL